MYWKLIFYWISFLCLVERRRRRANCCCKKWLYFEMVFYGIWVAFWKFTRQNEAFLTIYTRSDMICGKMKNLDLENGWFGVDVCEAFNRKSLYSISAFFIILKSKQEERLRQDKMPIITKHMSNVHKSYENYL